MEIHDLILNRNINTLKNCCMQYCRTALVESNEIVLILSDYDFIKDALINLTNNDFNLEKLRKEGSLVIVDSKKGFYSMLDHFVGIIIMVKMLLRRSENFGKNGVTVISDMGLFFHLNRIEDLIIHEKEISSSATNLKVKIICAYNMLDFTRLNDEQKQLLQTSHNRVVSLD